MKQYKAQEALGAYTAHKPGKAYEACIAHEADIAYETGKEHAAYEADKEHHYFGTTLMIYILRILRVLYAKWAQVCSTYSTATYSGAEESALTVARGVLESIFVPSNLPSAQR